MPQRTASGNAKNLEGLATGFQLLPISCILNIFSERLDPCRLDLNFVITGLPSPIISQKLFGVHAPARINRPKDKNSGLGCDGDFLKLSSEDKAKQQLGQWPTSSSETDPCCCCRSWLLTTSTDQEGHSKVRDLGCHYMPAPYDSHSGK